MTILVVDDLATNRKLLRAVLEAEGYTALEAADGVAALRVLEAEPVDAVISDILMPNMDGYRLCHELRRSRKFSSLPFIHYTSTYTSAGDQQLSEMVGADNYITKPLTAEALLAALHEGVTKSEARKSDLRAETTFVMKRSSGSLVNKIEEKNAELERALAELEEANTRITQLNQDLEERVRQRTAALEAASRDLARRNQEIESFYHTLSHELKTPLTSAREFVSIVLDGLGGPVSEKQWEYLALARESCDQIRVCLNDLLDSTRLDTGKFSLDLKGCALEDLIEPVMAALAPATARKRLTVNAQTPGGLAEVRVDPHRIKQVLTNLVNNAIKFTPDGGSIEITTGEAGDAAGFVRVSVADTGRGIPGDQLERVFDRLYQVKRGDAATDQGLGLGLYLCRQLIELHGGRIWIESEIGKGSTLTFTLPKAPAGESRAGSKPPPPTGPGSPQMKPSTEPGNDGTERNA